MSLYAIADLHMSKGDKPMDVFGSHWEDHFRRIADSWQAMVSPEDIVLLPGDLSWEMHLEGAMEHLAQIGALPGKKVILRGNHDYWWTAIGRLRSSLPEGMLAVQNDAVQLSTLRICGTRGWVLPADGTSADDKRIFERELLRLEMSLQRANALDTSLPLVAMLHYPPCTAAEPDTPVTALLEKYNVSCVVFGHLHGVSTRSAFTGEHNGIDYHLVSCDHLRFAPKRIL